MTLLAIPLVQGVQLPSSVAVQYTCPSNSRTIVRHVSFTNTTGGAITVTYYVVPAAGAVGDPTTVLKTLSIAANTAYTSPDLAGVVLNAGDTLQGFASAATSISMQAHGIQQT